MKESSTYQAILEEGRQEGVVIAMKKVLRFQGEEAFGIPDARTSDRIGRINDLTQLEDLLRRLPSMTSWQELLGSPVGGSRKGRRRSP